MHEARRVASSFASECRIKRIKLSLQMGESLNKYASYGGGKVMCYSDAIRISQVVSSNEDVAIRDICLTSRDVLPLAQLINLSNNAIRFADRSPTSRREGANR